MNGQDAHNFSVKVEALGRAIASACKEVGRDPSEVSFLAVTKSASLEQMQEAYAQGVRDFGEGRLQAALVKISSFPADVRWHFIGRLQSNKIAKIVAHFAVIHSVDSLASAQLIAEKARELGKRPELFLQVNTSGESAKGGFSEELIANQWDEIAALNFNLRGLMTMAPLTEDASEIRQCFHRLKLLRDQLCPTLGLSMGMSQDFPLAIAEGATLLRIGSLLF